MDWQPFTLTLAIGKSRARFVSRKDIANFPERLRWNKNKFKCIPEKEANYIVIHAAYHFWAILAILIRSVLPVCCVWKYITRLRWPACIKNNPKFIHIYFSAENYSSLFFNIREVTCGSCVATFFMHVMYMKQQVYWNDKQSNNFFGPPATTSFRTAGRREPWERGCPGETICAARPTTLSHLGS